MKMKQDMNFNSKIVCVMIYLCCVYENQSQDFEESKKLLFSCKGGLR
ncbi:hypothetical protein Hanom_Chr16g01424161 [Helianthus anomalus]